MEEKRSIARNFRVWEQAKQKEYGESEVYEREFQRSELLQLHEQAGKYLKEKSRGTVGSFSGKTNAQEGVQLKKHERELLSLRERQEAQRETQRHKQNNIVRSVLTLAATVSSIKIK